jgi:hypothetical protein
MSTGNWPKEWTDILMGAHELTEAEAEIRLIRLHKVGALKDPPKAREWWMCPKCQTVESASIHPRFECCNGPAHEGSKVMSIKVKEVTYESD